MDISELYEKERMALREELHNLKNCQITFLTTSVTATGVLLGFATTLARAPDLGLIFLFPLIVLLPSWWIFFDKATSITRIVGYYRILEKLILHHCKANKYIGWESALAKFRDWQANGTLFLPKEQEHKNRFLLLLNVILLRTGHKYWVISYYTFLALSGLCVVVSIATLRASWLILIPVTSILFLLSVWWNARTVWWLIYGRYSYDCNEYFWRQILEINSKTTTIQIPPNN